MSAHPRPSGEQAAERFDTDSKSFEASLRLVLADGPHGGHRGDPTDGREAADHG